MLDLRQERGLTYLFITHDLSLAWVIADRIAVMYLGKIMEIGPADQVIKSPHHPYTAPSSRCRRRRSRRPRRRGRSGRSSSARRRMPRGSRRAAGSIRAARWRSTAARTEEPPLFDVGAGSRPRAGWPRAAGRLPVLPTGSRGRGAELPPPRPRHRRVARRPDAVATGERRRATRPALPALPPAAIADLLAASRATVVARARRPRRRGRLATGAGRVERQRVRRAPHRGRAARVRRPDPPDPRGRPSRHPARPRGLGPAGGRRGAARPPRPAAELAAEFAALRRDGVALVRGLTAADLGRVGLHPEVGPLRVDELLGEWVHHDRNHVRQMLAVTQARVWGQMGNARRFSLEDL